jgi:alpha-mannosidase
MARAKLPLEAIARAPGHEVRHKGELEVAEPGWVMYLVSHFHYDPVWWNTQAAYTSGWDELAWAQDRRERFQHSGLALVEAHMQRARLDPGYKFVLAEVDYLKPFWDLYPDRRAELRRLLAEGRLEIAGGTYNEPNTNLTGAETAVRCAVYGMGFQRDVLGARPESAWQLDVFGHDPSFPGMMAACGISSSSWARGPFHQWGPKLHTGATSWMQFPSEFEWVSPNGKGLLTSYMPDHYSAGWQLDEAETLDQAMERAYSLFCDLAAVSATKATLLPVGTDYTPPNRWVTRLAKAWSARYAWPRFVPGLPKEFFAAVRAEMGQRGRAAVPQTRDMGPVYTGKDVSFIDTKQAQRGAETALVEAEKLATFALALGHPYSYRAADKAWRQLVFNAHHDGITGSESDQVYLDLLGGWREAHELADALRASAMRAISSHIDTRGKAGADPKGAVGQRRALVVFNSLDHERSDVVTAEIDLSRPGSRSVIVRDSSGEEIPTLCGTTALHSDGTAASVKAQFFAGGVPALGYRCFWVEPSPQPSAGWQQFEGARASNEHYLVEADASRGGCLSRVTDLASGYELLATGQVGNEILVYPEYAEHPTMKEGPWHLLPAGEPVRSSSQPASVRAERSVLGERLVVEGTLGSMSFTQVVTLLAGSPRVGLRLYLHGFSGTDELVRLRFPTALRGGTPLAEVANAVVARSFALIDADSAVAPWTLDSPAQGWFGLGPTLSVQFRAAPSGAPAGSRALGVAEVVTPAGAGANPEVRELMVAMVGKGVTASCTEAGANRYGGLLGDSNLPDFRVSIGGADENELTAAVLEGAGEGYLDEFARQLATAGQARLWVPASRTPEHRWVPGADVRGARDLPVLVVAGSDEARTTAAVRALAQDVRTERLVVEQPAALLGVTSVGAEPPAPDWTAAVLNRGTPGFAVDAGGALYCSLLRSCTGWPSGVWIDPPRRTAPDGSGFELEHWSHVFDHALVAGKGDWRAAGCVGQASAFNTPLQAVSEKAHSGELPRAGTFLELSTPEGPAAAVSPPPGQVVLAALKPAGNPLAAGALPDDARSAPGLLEVTARLYESTGRPARIGLRAGLGWSIAGAAEANLLEEVLEPLPCSDGVLAVDFAPCEIRTLRLVLRRSRAAQPARDKTTAQLPQPPSHEPAQPVFARYWLHNKGPAPMGNQLLAVHLGPTSLRARAGGPAVSLVATVASDASDACGAPDVGPSSPPVQTGSLELDAPPGWQVAPERQAFRLAPGAHDMVEVRLSPPWEAKPGRYFVAARVTDVAGQCQEDVVTVDVLPHEPLEGYGPLGGYEAEDDAGSRAHLHGASGFGHPGSQAANEVEAYLLQEDLVLQPGCAGTVELVVVNRTRSPLRGEAQLISPVETWALTGPWAQGFSAPPQGEARVGFWARVPTRAGPTSSWLLVKLMYFGRLWYSPAVRFAVVPSPGSGTGRAGG